MNIIETNIAGVFVLEPQVHKDDRGFFMESWNKRRLDDVLGQDVQFVQDNHSQSSKGVLRGLHFQLTQPQGKLVRVLNGSVFDVSVDLRKGSCTFGQSVCVELSEANQRQIWIPEGFAHGFLVLSERADVFYKTTNYYHPESEQFLLWNDPALAINWPVQAVDNKVVLSAMDRNAKLLSQLVLGGSV